MRAVRENANCFRLTGHRRREHSREFHLDSKTSGDVQREQKDCGGAAPADLVVFRLLALRSTSTWRAGATSCLIADGTPISVGQRDEG